MFGLMRHSPRLPYCGTCKTLGVRYGQPSRMLLNHHIAFLAEPLVDHAGEPEWTREYRSYNCLSKPKEIPAILDYAAAVTVILTHYRVADHGEDTGRRHWRAASRLLSPAFRKASARLELSRIGSCFGRLVYVLDAHEDRARDAREGTFHALARFAEIDGRAEILQAVEDMSLPGGLQQRLRANVEERLGMRPRVLCCVSRQTMGDRRREAVAFAVWFPHQAREAITVPFNLMALGTLFATPAGKSPLRRICGDSCGGCCDGCDCS